MELSKLSSDCLNRKRRRVNAFFWTLAILAVGCLIGFLFCIIMMGLGSGDLLLYGILSACFFAAAGLFGLCAYPCFLHSDRLAAAELDALEREDDPFSFFVGEGTLATFRKEDLYIHGGETVEEDGEGDGDYEIVHKKKSVVIPYFDVKFFSVCTRRYPAEGGKWSIVMQIPARYFNKGAVRDAQPLLVQTDGKERLYRRMEELGLKAEGEPYKRELPADGSEPKENVQQEKAKQKYTRLQKFELPDRTKRSRAFLLLIFGVLFLAGGILSVIFWDVSVGSVIILVGGYMGVRALIAYLRAKAQFSIYREGIYYKEPTDVDSVFLKWEEFSSVCRVVRDGKDRLRAQCPYGAYDFPVFEGAYEAILKLHPEKAQDAGEGGKD